jgi:hypothetical protein
MRRSDHGRSKDFSFSKTSESVLGPTQPHIQWLPAMKQPGLEIDHSPSPSAEDKNEWSYTSISPCIPLWHAQEQLYLVYFLFSSL